MLPNAARRGRGDERWRHDEGFLKFHPLAGPLCAKNRLLRATKVTHSITSSAAASSLSGTLRPSIANRSASHYLGNVLHDGGVAGSEFYAFEK
jgi:hypothetical protein